MTDEIKIDPPLNTIRGLVQDVVEHMDTLAQQIRDKEGSMAVRPSDIRTLQHIVRRPRTLNDLSEAQGISRQAAHSSVQRLLEKGLIEFEFVEGSKRDKVASMSKLGHELRTKHSRSFMAAEERIAEIIGRERLEELRKALEDIAREF